MSASSSPAVRCLSLNFCLRPPFTRGGKGGDYRNYRLNYFVEHYMSNYDILLLQEVFGTFTRRKKALIKKARELGFIASHTLGAQFHKGQPMDGGLLILSRFPIQARGRHYFRHRRTVDGLAAKGVISALIAVPRHRTEDMPIIRTESSGAEETTSDMEVERRHRDEILTLQLKKGPLRDEVLGCLRPPRALTNLRNIELVEPGEVFIPKSAAAAAAAAAASSFETFSKKGKKKSKKEFSVPSRTKTPPPARRHRGPKGSKKGKSDYVPLLVFNTHLQAFYSADDKPSYDVIAKQMEELRDFIDRQRMEHPAADVLVGGDFNVDARHDVIPASSTSDVPAHRVRVPDSKLYTDMMSILGGFRDTVRDRYGYHPVTCGQAGETALAMEEDVATNLRLDYVLRPKKSGIREIGCSVKKFMLRKREQRDGFRTRWKKRRERRKKRLAKEQKEWIEDYPPTIAVATLPKKVRKAMQKVASLALPPRVPEREPEPEPEAEAVSDVASQSVSQSETETEAEPMEMETSVSETETEADVDVEGGITEGTETETEVEVDGLKRVSSSGSTGSVCDVEEDLSSEAEADGEGDQRVVVEVVKNLKKKSSKNAHKKNVKRKKNKNRHRLSGEGKSSRSWAFWRRRPKKPKPKKTKKVVKRKKPKQSKLKPKKKKPIKGEDGEGRRPWWHLFIRKKTDKKEKTGKKREGEAGGEEVREKGLLAWFRRRRRKKQQEKLARLQAQRAAAVVEEQEEPDLPGLEGLSGQATRSFWGWWKREKRRKLKPKKRRKPEARSSRARRAPSAPKASRAPPSPSANPDAEEADIAKEPKASGWFSWFRKKKKKPSEDGAGDVDVELPKRAKKSKKKKQEVSVVAESGVAVSAEKPKKVKKSKKKKQAPPKRKNKKGRPSSPPSAVAGTATSTTGAGDGPSAVPVAAADGVGEDDSPPRWWRGKKRNKPSDGPVPVPPVHPPEALTHLSDHYGVSYTFKLS